MTSRRTKISPKSGRGLAHVTSTIFGSTVGYPSDSLASCKTSFPICHQRLPASLILPTDRYYACYKFSVSYCIVCIIMDLTRQHRVSPARWTGKFTAAKTNEVSHCTAHRALWSLIQFTAEQCAPVNSNYLVSYISSHRIMADTHLCFACCCCCCCHGYRNVSLRSKHHLIRIVCLSVGDIH